MPEPPQCVVPAVRACAYCLNGFKPRRAWSVFCSDKCRADYDVDIGTEGRVRRISKLKTGTVALTIHLKGPAAERALNLDIGDLVRAVKTP